MLNYRILGLSGRVSLVRAGFLAQAVEFVIFGCTGATYCADDAGAIWREKVNRVHSFAINLASDVL